MTITNLPIDAGPVTLTFGGMEENVGGANGLLVAEMSTPLPDSELLEWSLRPADGGPLSDNLFSAAQISVDDVDWPGGEVCQYVGNSLFLYFTIDGAPQAMSDPNGFGWVFGPHPTDPAIQAWFGPFPPTVVTCSPQGGLSFAFGPELGFGTLLPRLGLDANTINDAHFGFEVTHAPVPVEPSTWGRTKGSYR